MHTWFRLLALTACAPDKAATDTAPPEPEAEATLLLWTMPGDQVSLALPVTVAEEDAGVTLSGAQPGVAFARAGFVADVAFSVTIDPLDGAVEWTGAGNPPSLLSGGVTVDGAALAGPDRLDEARWGDTVAGHAGRMAWAVEEDPWYRVELDLGVGPQAPVRWSCRSAFTCQSFDLPSYRSDAATAEATCNYRVYEDNPWLEISPGDCALDGALSVCTLPDGETRVLYPGWCETEAVREAVELGGFTVDELLAEACAGELDIVGACP